MVNKWKVLLAKCINDFTLRKNFTLVANRNATLTDLMLFLNSIAFRLSFIYLKEKELSHTKQLFTLWQSIIITYK